MLTSENKDYNPLLVAKQSEYKKPRWRQISTWLIVATVALATFVFIFLFMV